MQRDKAPSWVRKIPYRRKWQSTQVFWPGEFHGQRSLVGYSPRGCRESDMTEHTRTHLGPQSAAWALTPGCHSATWWAKTPETVTLQSQTLSSGRVLRSTPITFRKIVCLADAHHIPPEYLCEWGAHPLVRQWSWEKFSHPKTNILLCGSDQATPLAEVPEISFYSQNIASGTHCNAQGLPPAELLNSPASICSISVWTPSPNFLGTSLCLFHQLPLSQTPSTMTLHPPSGHPSPDPKSILPNLDFLPFHSP